MAALGSAYGDGMGERAVHHYPATCSWRGSTGAGYETYDRTHAASSPPATAELALTSMYHGDVALLDPERLVVIAASSCQLLSFLAVAARARIDVVAYDDEAVGVMTERDGREWLTEITLRPRITVVRDGDRPSDDRVRHLVEVAHRQCYVANSLRSSVVVEPAVTFVARG
jgi:organic hydroperoxide reductase OsmC/OhrA